VELAFFVANVEAIQNAVRVQVLSGEKPFGGIVVERSKDGAYFLRWCGADGNSREFRLESRL